MFNPRSLSLRFSLPYAIVLLVLVTLFLTHHYWQSGQLLRNQLDDTLIADRDALVEVYEIGGLDLVTEVLQKRLKNNHNDNVFYLMTDEDYRPILGNMPRWPEELPRNFRFGEIDYYGNSSSDKDIRFLQTKLDDDHRLLIGYETVQIEILEDNAEFNSILYLVLILMAGLTSGIYLHFKLNRKLKVISENCRTIHDGDLSIRLPVVDKGDEIDEMSLTLNEMLDQIQILMQDIQHITDNIAHDLRSPMTRMRGQLESLSQDLEAGDQQEKTIRAIEDLDGLLETFNAMLRLSQIETGTGHFEFVTVDLAAVTQDCVELYEALAEEKGQTIELTLPSEMLISGDKNLLFQSISNVLENAIKYSPDNSVITVRGESVNGTYRLSIQDQGTGIPAAEFPHITKRFYRLDKSRNQHGSGLGLSMVNAVVKLHKGELMFDGQDGLTVMLVFHQD